MKVFSLPQHREEFLKQETTNNLWKELDGKN